MKTNIYTCVPLSFSVDCILGDWRPWKETGACSATCGDGTRNRERSRKVTSPPVYGGRECSVMQKENKEETPCNLGKCPSDAKTRKGNTQNTAIADLERLRPHILQRP